MKRLVEWSLMPSSQNYWFKDTNLLKFCNVKNHWEGTGVGYTGHVDYTSNTRSVDSVDSFLLVKVARKEWPDSAVPQIICEAGCLLKRRVAVKKYTPVFAVLSNGTFFQFFAIDVDSVVYSSKCPYNSFKFEMEVNLYLSAG
jgi:hypothetical protein